MRYVLSVLALLALTADEARTQEIGATEGLKVSATIFGGGILPAADLDDGVKFNDAGVVGGALTVWPERHLGLRGNLLRTRTDATVPAGGSSPLEAQSPTVWYYGLDLVLQPTLTSVGRWGWAPYLFAGIGAKRYTLNEGGRESGSTSLAGDIGAGLEYRFNGHWGVQGEARHVISRFKHFFYRDRQRDWILTGGITVRI